MDFRTQVRERLAAGTLAREPEIVDELAQHLQELYQEALAAGASHEVACGRALSALPPEPTGLARAIESASRALPGLIADRWRLAVPDPSEKGRHPMFADFSRDVRYALRMLANAPALTVVVVVTLALGIGATATIFTAMDAILLRTPGVRDARSVVSVFNASTDGRERFSSWAFPDYVDVRDSGIFAEAAAYGAISAALDIDGSAQAVDGELVTGTYFGVLGTSMARGRPLIPDDDRPEAARAVVISYRFWQSRLGAREQVLDQSIVLNGNAFTIVGVAPARFAGANVGRAPDVWVPMALQQEMRPPTAGLRRSLGTADLLGQRGPRWLNVVARLRPADAAANEHAALEVVATRLQSAYPATNRTRTFTFAPLGEGPGLRTATRPLLRLLATAVVLVLLIACANVASLLLARAVSRRREVAVRVAVGAAGGRLVRQWLTEAVILAGAGALCGLGIAYWSIPLLHLAGIPETVPLGLNGRVLLFTIGAAGLSSILFGLAPALQVMRRDTISALRDEGGAIASGNRAVRLRRAFVVFQVAISLMLLVGAGLFLRTLKKAHEVDLGYQLASTMVADINLDVRGYSQEAGSAAYARILERLRAMPGVAGAGAARVTVLSGGARTTAISVDGRPLSPDGANGLNVRVNVVSDGYLDALGIPVLQGRDFTAADGPAAPRVAIISESLASKLWPGRPALGQTLGDGDRAPTVIGIVPHTVYRSAVERDDPPFFYLPLSQNYESGVGLHVRAAQADPLALLPAVRAAVREVDPRLVVARPQRLADVFEMSLSSQRMMAVLVAIFGAVALVLAAVGLYGVMAQVSGQRRNEIGIRLALGAEPGAIFRLVLGEGLRLSAIGAALGLTGAFAATSYVESQLFDVTPLDPLTYVTVCILLTAVATVACLIPARRAMRVDPIVALRTT